MIKIVQAKQDRKTQCMLNITSAGACLKTMIIVIIGWWWWWKSKDGSDDDDDDALIDSFLALWRDKYFKQCGCSGIWLELLVHVSYLWDQQCVLKIIHKSKTVILQGGCARPQGVRQRYSATQPNTTGPRSSISCRRGAESVGSRRWITPNTPAAAHQQRSPTARAHWAD